jgi:NAD+ synthase
METDLLTVSDKIIDWIKNYAQTNKLTSLVIGVSGGVDSGLVSALCAKTKLPTYVISMPIHQEHFQLERARNHCKWLTDNFDNVTFIEKDLTNTFYVFKSLFSNDYNKEVSFANSKSRLRMITLYQVAGSTNGIVIGTGNKVEDFGVGFYTKYGDGGVDISPIADLTKTEVRKMAKIIGVPKYIVTAKPTDGLWEDNRTDEDQIGASYEELEWAMKFEGTHSDLTDRQHQILKIYNKFNTQNKHKMLSIPIFKK